MKNLITKSLLLACLFLTQTAMSCEEPIILPTDNFAVELEVDYKGKLGENATIEYRDENGDLQTIPLTKDWEKSFTAMAGFNLYLRVKGNIDGRIKVSSTVVNNGDQDTDTSQMNYDQPTDFDIIKEETL